MNEIVLSVIIPAIITALVSLWMGRWQNKAVRVNIEEKYQSMLNKEIDERHKLAERFDALEIRLDKVERAYYRSLAHIRRVDPNNPAPDFLEWDTGRLRSYYRERFGE